MGQTCTKPTNDATGSKGPVRKVTKRQKHNLKETTDTNGCNITGLAITKDGHILAVDGLNEKVKLFNQEMKLCSSVIVPGAWDIDVRSETEAVVGGESSLTILDMKDNQLSIQQTIQLSDDIYGICKHRDGFLVTFPNTDPACIKLLDQSGKESWSLSRDNHEDLFVSPWYAAPLDERAGHIVVTDRHTNALIVVKGNNGDIIARRTVEDKGPFGVGTDGVGHVCLCYCDTREVAMLSEDLKEESILLSKKNGLGNKPQAIVYDTVNDRILVSYFLCNTVDSFHIQASRL